MKNNEFQQEAAFALNAVAEASRLARMIQDATIEGSLQKQDRSPVTVADFAVQALLAQRLSQHFPEDQLVGEESSSALFSRKGERIAEQVVQFLSAFETIDGVDQVRRWVDRGKGGLTERYWVIDPIDGTKGFLRGDQYAIAVALVVKGQVQMGVLGCSRLDLDLEEDLVNVNVSDRGSLFLALRGRGSFYGPEDVKVEEFVQLQVSRRQDLSEVVVLRSFESDHTNTDQLSELVKLLEIKAPPLGVDSQVKYGLLAAGKGDILLRLLSPKFPDYREKIWDHAAGSLIVEEAGGRVSDLSGAPLDFTKGRRLESNRGIFASNGLLHAEILNAVRGLAIS